MKISSLVLIIAFMCLCSFQEAYAQKNQPIKIDPSSSGRQFMGIGALSAGASSRLLMDYPEPQRSQLMDLLFKPNFGASLQILKVEIGGDVNSTDGTEPSFAHTREEFLNPKLSYFHRGYEWYIMKEAKKRNPGIGLNCLQWGAPGWIGNGRFYSKDNINFVISYVKNVKKYDGLSIDYVGLWNETMFDVDYIKELRKSLDSNNLQQVGIVAADQTLDHQWEIKNYIEDKELLNSIAIFGDHYPSISKPKKYDSHALLKATGKPLQNSEGGLVHANWDGFKALLKIYNRDYIVGKMTSQITWALISSYYDNLAVPNSGLMIANTPWSGHFDISPSLWAPAHTTQFAKPGWRYLDDACGFSADSTVSYVTFVSPDAVPDYSIIIEAMDAKQAQKLDFELSGKLSAHSLSVWKSVYQQEAFVQQKDIKPRNGKFSITVEPNAVYSITTTTGQKKGNYMAPENTAFPIPYHDDFEKDTIDRLPKYFSDQGGVFEVQERYDGGGKCLQQMMRQGGIEWWPAGTFVETLIGDVNWTDYEVSSKVNVIENTGSAMILGRITEPHRGSRPPNGYWFKIFTAGNWTLCKGNDIIKSGKTSFKAFIWHDLKMTFKGNSISVFLDDRQLASVQDNTYTRGMAGLGSGFNLTQFDDFSVKKL